jgi:hypothetical protein
MVGGIVLVLVLLGLFIAVRARRRRVNAETPQQIVMPFDSPYDRSPRGGILSRLLRYGPEVKP